MAEYDDDDSVVSREWEDYAWVDDPAAYMEEGDVEDERKKISKEKKSWMGQDRHSQHSPFCFVYRRVSVQLRRKSLKRNLESRLTKTTTN